MKANSSGGPLDPFGYEVIEASTATKQAASAYWPHASRLARIKAWVDPANLFNSIPLPAPL
jgi:hypothetical protein